MIYIGIDTGVHTGVCVWDGKHIVRLETLKVHEALQLVQDIAHANEVGGVKVIFEDARQRKWIPREMSNSQYRGRLMGAGSVKRDAVIWEDALTDWGVEFEAVAPHAGATKWSAEAFAKVTGWEGRTSDHARDAALLVFGRKQIDVKRK